MNNSSLPQEAKPTSKIWKYTKRTVIGIVTLIVILVVAVIIDSSNDPKPGTETPPVQAENKQPVETFNVEVTSQIVKKIDDKYRYFFDIRNRDTKTFEGKVEITLMTAEGKGLRTNDFVSTKPILPNAGSSEYMDVYTGPVADFGSAGYAKFAYKVKQGDIVVQTGEGAISDKYEDLSN